jgi:peptide/nickel transport system substrate-binding protein
MPLEARVDLGTANDARHRLKCREGDDMMRSPGLAAVAMIIAFLNGAPAEAGKANDTLNIEWDQPLDSVDAYFNTSREGILFSRMVWDNLIERDPDTFEYKPSLATSWSWIDDVTLDFELRQGVRFSNGQDFDADDVVYTFNFVADPANKVLAVTNVGWIKSAEKLGPYKVRVHLKAPFPAALEFIAGPLPIYPHKYYAEVGPQGMARKPIGSGPYIVTSLEPGKQIVFEKNTGYWEGSPRGKPHIGKIVQRTIPEKTTQIAEILSGGLDWMWYVPADQVEPLKSVPGLTVSAGETMRTGYLYFDAAGRSGKSPLQDVRVRRAIAHAVNREEFTRVMFGGESKVLKAPCFATQFGCYQDAPQYEFDPAEGKRLMAEAGYAEGFDTVLYAYRIPHQWEESLAGYMRAIGIRASINHLEYPAFRDKNHAGVTPISFGDWGSFSVNDVSAWLPNYFNGTSDDFALDKEIQAWLRDAGSTTDKERRLSDYQKAIVKIMDQMYMLPLNSYNIFYAYSSELDFKTYKDEIPRYYLYSWK